MAKKRNPSNKSARSQDHSATEAPRKQEQDRPRDPSTATDTSGGASQQRFEPNPPKPNLIILATSGLLMVGWMIFLFFVALR